MVSKFEDAVLRLLYPSIDSAEGHLPDHSSQDDESTKSDVVIWENLREEETVEPPAALLVDGEGGEEDTVTSPGKPSFTRAQRKRLKRKMQILKGKRFIGPRLPFQEQDGADSVHSGMDAEERQDAPSTPPSDNQAFDPSGDAVVMSKTKRRRLAKKQRVGHPDRQPQGAAFVADRVCDGVVIKHIPVG